MLSDVRRSPRFFSPKTRSRLFRVALSNGISTVLQMLSPLAFLLETLRGSTVYSRMRYSVTPTISMQQLANFEQKLILNTMPKYCSDDFVLDDNELSL